MQSSLPSHDEIRAAFTGNHSSNPTKMIPDEGGRPLLLEALNFGLASEANSAAVVHLLWDLLKDDSLDKNKMEENLVDAFWLVSSSLVVEDDSSSSNKKEAATKEDEEEAPAANGGSSSNSNGVSSRDALVRILQGLFAVTEEEEGGDKDKDMAKKKRSLVVQLQSHLDPALLEQAGLVASEKDLMKKLRMLNTKNYRQHKFNLLQEESEGFAKALEALIKGDHSSLNSIMGTFHVDPNRILDLALDVLIEENGSNKKNSGNNLDWLKEFSTEKIPALIAFKLKNTADSAPNTLKILQTIASLAIQEPSILPLAKMSDYLEPIEELLTKTFPLFTQIERKRVGSVGRVRLGGSSAARQKEEERDAKKQAQLLALRKQLEKTHRLQLLDILLEKRQWTLVQVLFPDQEELKQVMTLYKELGLAVCDWIQEELTPLCEKYCPTPADLLKSTTSKDSKNDAAETNISTAEEVVKMVSAPLACILDSGCIVGRPALFCQLCRLLGALLTTEHAPKEGSLSPSPTLYTFFESFLLPSLSLFPPNPSLPMEVWSILKLFPYTTRYRLYRDWRGVGLEKAGLQLFGDKKKPLVLVESEMHAGKDARYVLKRLSKDTIRESCRQVAKVTHSSPLVMFTTVLNQIESYDNLVSVMVEAVRFVSPLGLDVLGFCMLSRLCGSTNNEGDRSRSKEGGINAALWLQSMESFIGSFYERCPNVEFRGIICYVMRRLRDGHVTELGVLSSLLKTTGGWQFADYSPAASLSAAQLEGRAGTTLLRRETMTFGVVEKFNLRSSQQLRSVLQSEDMGVSLLILLAQVRARIVFDDQGGRPKPVKLLGSLVDTSQAVLSTLLDFLTRSSTLAQPLPSSKQEEDNDVKMENGDDKTSDEYKHSREIEVFATSMPKLADLVNTYGIDMATAWMLCRPLVRAAERKQNDDSANDSVQAFTMTEEVRSVYKPLVHSEATWSDIDPELFEMFYLHTLYDLFCPESIYSAELNRTTKEVERLNQRQSHGGTQLSLQPGSVGGGPQQNNQEEVERLKTVAAALADQVSEQKKRVEVVHQKMKDTSETFFPKKYVSVSAVNTFLSQCVFPRCMQGPDDAIYCAHFVSLLHQGETPGFSTLHYLDELFSVLSGSLFGVTEGEAANLSILLLETWKLVSRWRYDETAFEEEVSGKPGSFMVDPVEEGGTTSEGNIFPVTFEQYKALFIKWHTSIGAAALGCLESSEYMHTRASLIVLSRIVEVFPSRPNLGNKLFEVLEPLKSEGNALPDIRSAAQSYFMQLTKARTDGVWKEEDAAVVQARLKAEKEAQEMRKRKAAERFDDMKMENEKISAEVGGDDRRGGRDRERRGHASGGRDVGRGGPIEGRRSPHIHNARTPTKFEPPPPRGGSAPSNEHARRPAPVLGSLGRETTHAVPPRSRGGAEPPSRGGRNDDEPRSLEGRWEGGAGGRGRSKRGRSPSPEGDRDGRGGRGDHKRARRNDDEPKGGDQHANRDSHRSGDRGGGRRRGR